MQTWIHNFDSFFIRIVQRSRYFYWPMKLVTQLGHPTVIMAISIGLVWRGWPNDVRIVTTGMIVLVTLGLGSYLKLILRRKRPLTDYVLRMRVKSHSFPSGHATGATVAYGALAYLAGQYVAQPIAGIIASLFGLLVIVVGISRVYLGAHFPSDVVAGWLLGGIGLLLIIFMVKP